MASAYSSLQKRKVLPTQWNGIAYCISSFLFADNFEKVSLFLMLENHIIDGYVRIKHVSLLFFFNFFSFIEKNLFIRSFRGRNR